MNDLFVLVRSIIYVPLFILLFGWLALEVKVFDKEMGIRIPPGLSIIGIILMAGGGLLVLVCAGVFVLRGKGTPAVFDPPKRFVASGPYAYVRNPMYIGGFLLLAGFGFYHLSPSILASTILYLVIFHLFVVLYEEPVLREKFGESYINYTKKVRRWLPKFTRYSVS
jgi:protein-S-isoprenylcysteine O-methyltransferase Ste14